MRKRRIFIAISPPEELQEQLFQLREKWLNLPCRWVKPQNIHLTLIPPMYLDETQIAELVSALRERAKTIAPFQIELERIIYGPPGKPSRMLWAVGKESGELMQLKKILENTTLDAEIPFQQETRPFTYPHLTLARMYQEEWRSFQPKPEINEEFHAKISVDRVEVMESILQRGGAEYSVFSHIPLGGE